MTKAAAELGLSQPSVSLQIQALEHEFGTSLFERRGRQMRLTKDGEALFKLAQPLVEGVTRLRDDFISQRYSLTRGEVSVAAGGSTLQYILPPFIEQFVREYPQIELKLHNVTGKAGLALLRDGAVDVAVGPMLEAPPDISFYPFVAYEPMLITASDHPLAARKRVLLKDIAKYPLILPPKDQSTYRLVETVFEEHALHHEVRLEVGGYDVIKTYVRLGLGISIVMSHCLSEREALHCVSMGRYFPSRSYGLVQRKGSRLSPAVQRFVQTVCPD